MTELAPYSNHFSNPIWSHFKSSPIWSPPYFPFGHRSAPIWSPKTSNLVIVQPPISNLVTHKCQSGHPNFILLTEWSPKFILLTGSTNFSTLSMGTTNTVCGKTDIKLTHTLWSIVMSRGGNDASQDASREIMVKAAGQILLHT